MQQFVIATRKSKLALIQSEMIADALLLKGDCEVELLPMTTTGDKEKDKELLAIGGKGLFTKEIETALLSGEANLAMHSLKDMPIKQPDGLMIGAVLPRANASDILITHRPASKLADLPRNAKIGTSSPRRAAQLLALRPDFTIVPFRGNVPTRLKKIEEGKVDATVLAAAGLHRLGLNPQYSILLDTLPAIGQGIIAVQCRMDDDITREWLDKINHTPSWYQMLAERSLLASIEGDCHSPLAGHANVTQSSLTLTAQILSEDGSHHAVATQSGNLDDAVTLGKQCAEILLPKAIELWQPSS